jgi:hypothetical protein
MMKLRLIIKKKPRKIKIVLACYILIKLELILKIKW